MTVSAITRKAGYNRATFYNHYDDLRSMIDELENDIIGQVRKKITGIFSNGIPDDIRSIPSLMFPVFKEYFNTLYILSTIENGDLSFLQKYREMIKVSFQEIFLNRLDTERAEYIFTFMYSSGVGLFEHWYNTGKKYSFDEFLKFAQSLLATGVLGQLIDNIDMLSMSDTSVHK